MEIYTTELLKKSFVLASKTKKHNTFFREVILFIH
ncbi:hypothetical protein SAMN06265377_2899 [Flagellimonas pacifica]|uniref:Uncharacterized protein n=1 Tax=Flagellimonas pacifica TaxID=1247520 RepID=A0A285MV49_9FLAO|nr:hypothetical protein SAMN06265377_2899 [Allomuricauda parva]